MKVLPLLALALLAIWFLVPANPQPSVLLSRFSTSLEGRTHAQRHNALLAVEKLNGVVIQPRAEFSFNNAVGSWSRDQGYRRAPVSYNGTLIADWGGGVCQTSTTVYNAALLAGMKVTERNPHRFAPGYVPPGRDAAVAYGDIDLRFINPYSKPVLIKGGIDGDRLEVSFFGTEALKAKPQIVTEIDSVEEPHIYRLSGDGGTHFIKNSGKIGCSVNTYRVTGDVRELLSTDNYPVMNKVEQRS